MKTKMSPNSFTDLAEFFGSTATTIIAQGQRVRNLIGDKHWFSDGTYKERLIKDAIREVIPANLKVGDGFVVYKEDKKQKHFQVSRQTDILVYDDRFVAPLFKDGDFVIILAETAIAAVEVKSSWGDKYSKIEDEIYKIQSVHSLFRLAKKNQNPNPDLFTACIAYGTNKNLDTNNEKRYQKLIVHYLKKGFITGLKEFFEIEQELSFEKLKIIKYEMVKQLCPQMIISLDQTCILWPGVVNSANINKYNFHCPVIRTVPAFKQKNNGESVNLSLHIYLATLRDRCIEWLNQGKSKKDFDSLRSHLNSFLYDHDFSSSKIAFTLIPEIDRIKEIFPKVKF